MKLYGHINRKSPNSFKLAVALAECGATYDYMPVDLGKGEQRRPEFLALNPHGKVPVLVDEDFTLGESDAILWYIAEAFPAAKLLPPPTDGTPAARRQRARVLQWCDFASTAVYPAYSEVYMHTSYLPAEKRSAVVAESGMEKLARAIAVLEAVLGARSFLAGNFSIADIALASIVQIIRVRLPGDPTNRPAINAWMDFITARPSWTKTLASAG